MRKEIKTITLKSRLNKIDILIMIYNHLISIGAGKEKAFFEFQECFKYYDELSKDHLIDCFKCLFISEHQLYIIDTRATIEEITECVKNFKIKIIDERYKKELFEIKNR
jgi:hypothetical protein